jgi:hypothetical protein
MLLANEAKKRSGPTKIRTNSIARPRRLQIGRRRLLLQISFGVWVSLQKIVEADQIRPTKMTLVLGPRARIISSIFLPNNWPKAGAINSILCTMRCWSINGPRLKLAMPMLRRVKGKREKMAYNRQSLRRALKRVWSRLPTAQTSRTSTYQTGACCGYPAGKAVPEF